MRRRINNLIDRGYIRSFSALLDYKRMGNAVKANVLAKVEKEELEKVANSLKKNKNVHMLSQVIGDDKLANKLRSISNKKLRGEALRKKTLATIEKRIKELKRITNKVSTRTKRPGGSK